MEAAVEGEDEEAGVKTVNKVAAVGEVGGELRLEVEVEDMSLSSDSEPQLNARFRFTLLLSVSRSL